MNCDRVRKLLQLQQIDTTTGVLNKPRTGTVQWGQHYILHTPGIGKGQNYNTNTPRTGTAGQHYNPHTYMGQCYNT